MPSNTHLIKTESSASDYGTTLPLQRKNENRKTYKDTFATQRPSLAACLCITILSASPPTWVLIPDAHVGAAIQQNHPPGTPRS